MTPAVRRAAVVLTVSLAVGCASAPKDAGFGEVRRTVIEQTRQPVEWDPAAPVRPPDDAAVMPQLQEELTADRAVEIAFANNRDVQATLEELGIARGELLAAGTIRNPLFHAEVRFADDSPNPIEFGLAQSVFDLIQLKSRKRMGRARFEATRVQVVAAIVHFAAQVRTDYFDLLAARKILARQETVMKAQEAAAELALRQHRAGNISDLDLENEQSRYEQVKLDHARAELDELSARERVISDLGLVRRADLKLPDEFPEPEAIDLTPEAAEEQAVARRLDIRIARSEIEAAERAVNLAGTAFLDETTIGVHHEREPEGQTTTGPEVELPIPIFDRGAADRTRARAMLRQAQQRLAAMTVSARSEARAALERQREARARMDYLRGVVTPRRERILRLTQLEYNAMLRGVYQLIEARQNLATAQREEILAERDYWAARTELDTALRGVGGFSIKREGGEQRRLDLFAPPGARQTKPHEGE
jgi:cobalt-zinc-cadmium efflux system outer membrane protein